jgi:PKD repeat protein
VNVTSGGDLTPPASITGLENDTVSESSILWMWVNPTDSDFNHTMIYRDGAFQYNVSNETTDDEWTSLAPSTEYTISTHTVDIIGNVNLTWVNLSATTDGTPDTTPPASITNLGNNTATDISIEWTWTNPTDPDFNHTMIYQNGTFYHNVSTAYDTWTGLTAEVEYTISTHTVDTSGNVNSTWVNRSVTTAESSIIPVTDFYANVTGGGAPLAVGFTDNSTNEPTNWDWYWSDDETKDSDLQNPTETFAAGYYNVRLYASNTAGGDWENKTEYISSITPPTANFTADVLEGPSPLVVTFTDSSTDSPTSWQWSYGDGSANGTTQNPVHSYTAVGLWTVGLTASNAGGSSYFQRVAYINVTATTGENGTLIDIGGTPKIVQFRIQTVWGEEIPGATISIQGITTTTGAFGYIISLLNLPLNEAPIANTLLTGTTDTFGVAEFLMVPTTKYNVTVTAPGYTFPSLYVYPHNNEYVITANILEEQKWVQTQSTFVGNMFMNVSTIRTTDAYQGVNVSFIDTTGTASGGFINITQGSTVLRSAAITPPSMWVNQSVTVPIGGTSVLIRADIVATNGTFNKTTTVSFVGPPVTIPGISPIILQWVAFGCIILMALMAKASTAPHVSIIVVLFAWFFLFIGWFAPLVAAQGMSKVVMLFSLATVIAILWNFREGKRQETGR